MTLRDALVDGFSINRKKGGRAKHLEVQVLSKSNFDGRFLSDANELDGVLSASINSSNHSQRKGGGLFAKRNR
jgi:hypothetical protein